VIVSQFNVDVQKKQRVWKVLVISNLGDLMLHILFRGDNYEVC